MLRGRGGGVGWAVCIWLKIFTHCVEPRGRTVREAGKIGGGKTSSREKNGKDSCRKGRTVQGDERRGRSLRGDGEMEVSKKGGGKIHSGKHLTKKKKRERGNSPKGERERPDSSKLRKVLTSANRIREKEDRKENNSRPDSRAKKAGIKEELHGSYPEGKKSKRFRYKGSKGF